jgi:hypothetical protein
VLNGIDFSSRIGDIARHLLGEPNARLSNPRTLRFGRKGALAVYTDGNRRGFWRDFATGDHGGALDLIVRERGGDRAEAFAWLRSERLVRKVDETVPRLDRCSRLGLAPITGRRWRALSAQQIPRPQFLRRYHWGKSTGIALPG